MIDTNQIYREDCLTFMDKMSSQNRLVDVVVTSPPYNINKDYRSYDDNKKRDVYLTWLEDVGKKIKSVMKDDGSFFLNISGRPSDPKLPFDLAISLTENIGFKLQNTIHWIKSVSFDPEDIGRNNRLHNCDNISIGHFKPIVNYQIPE